MTPTSEASKPHIALDEVCRRLGEAQFKQMFLDLNAAGMKRVMGEAGIAAVRLPSHTSTRRRNEDWAGRLARSITAGQYKGALALIFQWLSHARTEMLCTFLDHIGVPHQRGLTDADFVNETPEERLLAAAQEILNSGRFERRDVAVYLIFLDLTNRSQKFTSLQLDQYIPTAA